MGLSTSMWTGVSGLLAHGQAMQNIGNNLANVNTIGFKSQRVDFEDLIYTDTTTGSGLGQVGEGVRVGTIMSDFSQGGFETTNNSTDLAISGLGFFNVKDQANNAQYYTRAGDFRFDKNGFMVDPHNLVLQGWAVDKVALRGLKAQNVQVTQVPTKGSPTNVRLDTLALAAQGTSTMSVISNLNPATASKSTSTTQPFFSMFQNYKATSGSDTGLADTAFGFQATMKVYDQRGGSHDITVYYDKVSDVGGKEYWEYMVCCKPSEDGRTFNINGVDHKMSSDAKAGVLMIGTMSFTDTGSLKNITAYTLNSDTYTTPVSNLGNWTQATLSSSGYPVLTANFRSVSGGSITSSSNATKISMNFGIGTTSKAWSSTATSADQIGKSHLSNASRLDGFSNANLFVNNIATTNYETTSATLFLSQDGYPPGTLQSVSVDTNGVLSGRYSNGQVQELYVLTLADFASPWGLKRDGSNLFSETVQSGSVINGRAGSGRLGTINPSSLETSNVDMATEMVNMINIQRGFQANSKVITTADSMLADVIQLKR